MDCRTALLTVLDQVDYTSGACGVTEMVGAVLPKEVIALARKAIADEAAQQSAQADGATCPEHGEPVSNLTYFASGCFTTRPAANANRWADL